jgi:hypothetical protein
VAWELDYMGWLAKKTFICRFYTIIPIVWLSLDKFQRWFRSKLNVPLQFRLKSNWRYDFFSTVSVNDRKRAFEVKEQSAQSIHFFTTHWARGSDCNCELSSCTSSKEITVRREACRCYWCWVGWVVLATAAGAAAGMVATSELAIAQKGSTKTTVGLTMFGVTNLSWEGTRKTVVQGRWWLWQTFLDCFVKRCLFGLHT